MKSFSHCNLKDNLISIKDQMGYVATLVIGQEQALLFDTMGGIGDISAYLKTLTNLPINVVLSHAHFDHLGGAFLFDQVYLSKKEKRSLEWYIEHHINKKIFCNALKDQQFDPKAIHGINQPMKTEFLDLEAGMSFDLGGLTLSVISLPGHTSGSMGILVEEMGVLLSGDAMTPIMCLFFEESLTLNDYLQTLETVNDLNFDFFVTSHHQRLFNKKVLKQFKDCALFSRKNKGMHFQHSLIPEYGGMLHIYSGKHVNEDDFIAIITKC